MSAGRIDCDLHPAVPDTKALLPYLDGYWRDQIVSRGIDGLDIATYPPKSRLTGRPDWRPDNGKPGTSLDLLRRHALDGFGLDLAICNVVYGGQTVFNAGLGAALCGAVNDWLVAEWLDREPRLRGSIVVPMQDAALAVAEIERRAADPRFVQVLMLATGDRPLGHREYWPIYEAAQRHGLPVGIHAGAAMRFAPTYLGWPSYHIEDYSAQAQTFQGQLLSLIYEGVFQTFPNLTVVLIESGVTWLPGFMPRADHTWMGLRHEVPWVTRPPSELVRQHVRLTAQPFDAPDDPAIVDILLNQLGGDDMLLFATDYPHWQFDGDACLPAGLSPAMIQRLTYDNPRATYPRLRELVS